MSHFWRTILKPLLIVALFFGVYYFGGNIILERVVQPALGKLPPKQADALQPLLELDFGRVVERIFGFIWTLFLFFTFNWIFQRRSPKETVLFSSKHKLKTFLWGSFIGLVMISALIALSLIGDTITVKAVHLFPKDVFSTIGLYIVFIGLTAFSIEVAMRGYILETLKESWGTHLSVWVSALCFSLIFMGDTYYSIYGGFVTGLFLGYAYSWYGIYYCIGWHFLWNLVESIFFSGKIIFYHINDPFLAGNKALSLDQEGFLVLPVLLIAISIMLAFHKSEWRIGKH